MNWQSIQVSAILGSADPVGALCPPPLFTNKEQLLRWLSAPKENKLNVQTNAFSLQLLNCNLSGDKENLFTLGSGKDF